MYAEQLAHSKLSNALLFWEKNIWGKALKPGKYYIIIALPWKLGKDH